MWGTHVVVVNHIFQVHPRRCLQVISEMKITFTRDPLLRLIFYSQNINIMTGTINSCLLISAAFSISYWYSTDTVSSNNVKSFVLYVYQYSGIRLNRQATAIGEFPAVILVCFRGLNLSHLRVTWFIDMVFLKLTISLFLYCKCINKSVT